MKLFSFVITTLIFCNAMSQTYRSTLFSEKDSISLEMWEFDSFRSGDSLHVFGTICRKNSIYSLRLDSIWSNRNLYLWSVDLIKECSFPVTVSDQYVLEIVDKEHLFKTLTPLLLDDVLKRYNGKKDEIRIDDPWVKITYYPGTMYEAYYQPFLECLKYYFNATIENGNKKIWAEGFKGKIPSILQTQVMLSGNNIIAKHRIKQDSIEICDFLSRSSNGNGSCLYPKTDFSIETELNKKNGSYYPLSIKAEHFEPLQSKVSIVLLD